jgi:heme exporter protein D
MNFSNWSEFLAMGGYGLYVWGSMGMCAAVVVVEPLLLQARRRALQAGEGLHAAPEMTEPSA